MYTNDVPRCPPPVYELFQQPSFPGYALTPLTSWKAQTVPVGSGMAALRIQGLFGGLGSSPPVTLKGWFMTALLSTGEQATVAVCPFNGGITLTTPKSVVMIDATISAAPSATAPNSGNVSLNFGASISEASRMAKLIRRTQRARLETMVLGLELILQDDVNIPTLSPRSIKTRTVQLPDTPIPPPVADNYKGFAQGLKNHFEFLLDQDAPIVP